MMTGFERYTKKTRPWEERNPPSTINLQQFDYDAEDAALANVA
jgi:hypothetical protein